MDNSSKRRDFLPVAGDRRWRHLNGDSLVLAHYDLSAPALPSTAVAPEPHQGKY
jgi:hypothetical protein